MTFTEQNDFLIIGHRGAAGLAPENTLPSFRKALQLGCPGVELDVYRVGHELAVIHDESLSRTTNRHGLVSELSAAELHQIDAGNGASIPTLKEVFKLVAEFANEAHPILVNIELKGPHTAAPVAKFLEHEFAFVQILVSSFDHAELATFRSLDTNTPVAPLLHSWDAAWLDLARELNASAVNLNVRIASAKRLGQIHAAGYRTFVYTVNSLRQAKRLASLGVAGIFTDRPDLMLKNWPPRS